MGDIDLIESITPGALEEYSGFPWTNRNDFLQQLALKKGRVRKGGEIDLTTTARIFMMDHIKGLIHVYQTPKGVSDEEIRHPNLFQAILY